jgi:hypothetical protein
MTEPMSLSNMTDRIKHFLRQANRDSDCDPVACRRAGDIVRIEAVRSQPGVYRFYALRMGGDQLVYLILGEVCSVAFVERVAASNVTRALSRADVREYGPDFVQVLLQQWEIRLWESDAQIYGEIPGSDVSLRPASRSDDGFLDLECMLWGRRCCREGRQRDNNQGQRDSHSCANQQWVEVRGLSKPCGHASPQGALYTSRDIHGWLDSHGVVICTRTTGAA